MSRRAPMKRLLVQSPPRATAPIHTEPQVASTPTGGDPRSTEELMRLHVEARAATPCDTQRVEELRNLLIERYMPLVHAVAQRLVRTLPRSVEFDDLVSAGVFGLMDAIRCFDPTRDVRFKTYATTRLRGSILDNLRSSDWVPRLVRTEATRVGRAIASLGGEYGREPTQVELSHALELDHASLARDVDRFRAPMVTSFAAPRDADSDSAAVIDLADTRTDPASADFQTRDAFADACTHLSPKERFILEQYYRRGHTLREIAETLQLTESRICQIHTSVLVRLRATLTTRRDLGGS
jgi:RNA polymerase sigma factor for flagellar operon FliA